MFSLDKVLDFDIHIDILNLTTGVYNIATACSAYYDLSHFSLLASLPASFPVETPFVMGPYMVLHWVAELCGSRTSTPFSKGFIKCLYLKLIDIIPMFLQQKAFYSDVIASDSTRVFIKCHCWIVFGDVALF